MEDYLLIGISFDKGFTWSMAYRSGLILKSEESRRSMVSALSHYNDNGFPDEVLLVLNDNVVDWFNPPDGWEVDSWEEDNETPEP